MNIILTVTALFCAQCILLDSRACAVGDTTGDRRPDVIRAPGDQALNGLRALIARRRHRHHVSKRAFFNDLNDGFANIRRWVLRATKRKSTWTPKKPERVVKPATLMQELVQKVGRMLLTHKLYGKDDRFKSIEGEASTRCRKGR